MVRWQPRSTVAERTRFHPGNAVTATERCLEYTPLIASALVECVFFDAGVPGPMRKAHELWTAARVEVCKNHVAGRQFKAQRSATANREPDEEPDRARDNRGEGIPRTATNGGGPGGNSDDADGRRGEGGDNDDYSDTADRRTRRRLANEPNPADDATAPSPGATESSRSSPPVAPAPASLSHTAASDVVPVARSPAHTHGLAPRTDDRDASGALAPSGASTGAQ